MMNPSIQLMMVENKIKQDNEEQLKDEQLEKVTGGILRKRFL